MKTLYFGEIALRTGELAVMDGGIHGVQGHTLVIAPDNSSARWERRVDSFRPHGEPGSGVIALDADEQRQVESFRDVVGGVAESRFFTPPRDGPPRWVWAVVLDDRVIEGGAIAPGDGAPPELAPFLAWLRARVDAAVAQHLVSR